MAEYSSNCPISRPTVLGYEEHAQMGGMSWNDRYGLFFATDDELRPMRHPVLTDYAPKKPLS